MILHYLTTALANFRKSPFTTAANVVTLALGLACFIAAFGIATYWRSADNYHAGADRTYVVGQGARPNSGGMLRVGPSSTAAQAKYLTQDFDQIETASRIYALPRIPVAADERKLLLNAAFADPDFLSMFDLDFVAGDARSALSQPNSIVLTQGAAERLFGDSPALGQSLTVGGASPATVTGVIAPVRQPSFLGDGPDATVQFDVIGDWNLSPSLAEMDGPEQWFSNQALTFIRLAPGASVEALNAQLPAFLDRHMPQEQRDLVGIQLEAYPVSDITTRNLDNMLAGDSALSLTAVGVLLALGALILLVAGVNYANLAAAQATLAAKEIGMRKALGAARVQIMVQSWLSSLLLTLLAAAVALLVVLAISPLLKSAVGVNVLYFLADGVRAAALVLGLTVLVGLAAGAYPALAMSGVRPVRALHSARSRSGPQFVARLLVGVQYAAASFLLILLTVSQLQRSYLEDIALGARTDPIVILNETIAAGVDTGVLTENLRQLPGVKSASFSDRQPWINSGSFLPLVRTLEAGGQEFFANTKNVSKDYFETLGLELVAGRTFDTPGGAEPRSIFPLDPSQPTPIVVDETLARSFGFSAPQAAVGQIVYAPASLTTIMGGSAAQPLQIIGVVDADPTWLGSNLSGGMMYVWGPDSPFGNVQFPVLRLAPENLTQTLNAIEQTWDQVSPDTPVDVRFFDQMFEFSYRQFSRMNQLFTLLAGVAFVIASLGLLGIAVHVAARRRHEIAVRKTLGSTTWGAVRLLLADFSKPVIVANLIAWPLGYLAAETYLSAFAHRIELSIWPFALSMLITLVIAWLAVGGQTYRAASVRPAQVLRDA